MYQSVRTSKETGLHFVSRRGNAKRYPHANVGTHQYANTTNPKVDANGETCFFQAHRQSR